MTPMEEKVRRHCAAIPQPMQGEVENCIAFCETTKLDPDLGQVWFQKRFDKQAGGNRIIPTVKIDGMRALAESSGEYEGQTPMYWCGQDGNWVDCWTQPNPPACAKVGIYRKGFREALFRVAQFAFYSSGQNLWIKGGGALMLAKCAEAAALRAAFPLRLSGVYSDDEMEQSAKQPCPVAPVPEHKGELAPPPALAIPGEPQKAAPPPDDFMDQGVVTPASIKRLGMHLHKIGKKEIIDRSLGKVGSKNFNDLVAAGTDALEQFRTAVLAELGGAK